MTQRKDCSGCGQTFEVADEDLAFYRRVSPTIDGRRLEVPPPSHCYRCRQQRKLSWRNERTLYLRKCDLSGKQLMSMYAPDERFTVYDFKEWFTDKWDPMSFGREYDFQRSFFEQFNELHQVVPLPSLFVDSDCENCDYTNFIKGNRNCYFIFAASGNEDCLYTTYLQRNKDVVDCFFIFDSELCYQCIDCYQCYNLMYSQFCSICRDSHFLHNCSGCSDCYACVSLVNKQYHIFNQAYTRTEYEKQIRLLLSREDRLDTAEDEVLKLRQRVPQKSYAGVNNQNVSGDHLSFSKNSFYCFDCTHLEDCKYCTWFHRASDCYDCYAWGYPGELGYENHLCGNTFYHVLFSDMCYNNVSDLLYCRLCINSCKNLFACVGLQHKEYCILNKQYSKEEYQTLVPRIVEQMKDRGEWGEFFPAHISPFGYNESVGQEYYPLGEREVRAKGWRWKETLPFTTGRETLDVGTLPRDSKAISDAISKEVLACQDSGKNYRITSKELAFYRRMGLSVPEKCFDRRYELRLRKRNPRHLFQRRCAFCQQGILTSYSPDSPDLVYCEDCYHREVR